MKAISRTTLMLIALAAICSKAYGQSAAQRNDSTTVDFVSASAP